MVFICFLILVVDNAPPLIVGDKVRVAVDGSRKMVKGMVLNIEYHDCCTISFMDRNWSDDVIPSDIVECECDRIGCGGFHVPGAKVLIFKKFLKETISIQ